MNFYIRYVPVILLFILPGGTIFAQSGSVAKDTTMEFGLNFSIHYNADKNHMLLQFKKYDKAYSPDTIREIAIHDNGKYISRYIDFYLPENKENKVFLKQIVFSENNNFAVYEFKTKAGRRLFYEKNAAIVEIPSDKQHLRDTLRKITSDNSSVEGAISYLSGSGRSLRKFFSLYENPSPRHYPLSTWGVQVGGIMANITGMSNMSILLPTPEADLNLSVGAFADISIAKSDFYFHPEIYYSQNSFSSSSLSSDHSCSYLIAKCKYFTVPVLFRYLYPALRWRPYGELGLFYTQVFEQFGNVYTVDWNSSSSNVYTKLTFDQDLIDKYQYGLAAGFGCLYQLNYKNAISLGFRYSRSFFSENLGLLVFSANLAYHF